MLREGVIGLQLKLQNWTIDHLMDDCEFSVDFKVSSHLRYIDVKCHKHDIWAALNM